MNLLRPRGVLWQLLELECDGSLLWVGNTHADALSADAGRANVRSSASQPSSHRCAQLKELFRTAESLVSERETACGRRRYERARVLVAGDLNTTRELSEVDIAADFHFEDAWVRANGDAPCHSWDGVRNPLVSSGFQVRRSHAPPCEGCGGNLGAAVWAGGGN